MRKLRLKNVGEGFYHVGSRCVDRTFRFDDDDKTHIVNQIRRMAAFCGMEVNTYSVMTNHFRILLHVDLAGLQQKGRPAGEAVRNGQRRGGQRHLRVAQAAQDGRRLRRAHSNKLGIHAKNRRLHVRARWCAQMAVSWRAWHSYPALRHGLTASFPLFHSIP